MEDKTREQFENSVRRGIEAQHFLQFVEREPYFKSLFVELDTEYVNAMLGLNPNQTDEFRFLQTKRMALYEPINRARMDVAMGNKAQEELEKTDSAGGIL